MSRQTLPPVQVRSRKSVERAIEGSIEVIREAGWAGFTMPAVSKKAEVSVPLLHRRFGGKEELFLAAQESVLQRMESDATAGKRYLLGQATPLPDLSRPAHPPLDRPVPGEVTRDRLIAAGVDLLAGGSYGDVTAAAVSRRAGFTVGALYTYFENKEELL